ncbi:hypothetical protein [Shewanella marina]|uniref:hypothetical protein n=1 Tax=Shewanella marina TaxID=487319 RepID=UPI000472DE14|nr:hypothetical protein [Shewanella marina]
MKIFESFNLKDALFIGFCATLLVVIKGSLRLKLGISGHSMFLMTFFYIICFGVVGRVGAITACGMIAGVMAMILGIGKGGPLILLKFLMPAVAMDIGVLLFAALTPLHWRFVAIALCGCIAWAVKGLIGDLLLGMSLEVGLTKFLMSLLTGGIFTVMGAWLVVPVIHRLKAHDLISVKIK